MAVAPAPPLTAGQDGDPGDGHAAATRYVTYTFAVTNTGNVTVTALAIADPMFAGAVAAHLPGHPLAPHATTTCTRGTRSPRPTSTPARSSNTATAQRHRARRRRRELDPPATATVAATQNPA